MPICLPRSLRNASVCSGRALPPRGLDRRRAGQLGLPALLARFAAVRPIYGRLVNVGFLRRAIPTPFGGNDEGMTNIAAVAEEFSCNDRTFRS